MPITTQAALTYQVQSVTIAADGACTVLLEVLLAGQRIQGLSVQLDAATCAPVWAGQPAPGVARWPDLRGQLYALLQAQGAIPAGA